MTFRYNEVGDFFTVDLETVSGGSSAPLVYGEVLRCGKPLFEAFNDERYPLPVLCPLCLTGDEIEEITYDNFGTQVRLYLFDRPGGGAQHPAQPRAGGQPLPRRRLPRRQGTPGAAGGRPGTGRRKRVSGGFKNGDRHSRRRGYPR